MYAKIVNLSKIQNVVAAIIKKNNLYLIAQRNRHKHLGLKWEFPGGKVNPNETFEKALSREIKEELSLECSIKLLLHSPGTLLSPWNNKLYTPIYFYIETNGNIFVQLLDCVPPPVDEAPPLVPGTVPPPEPVPGTVPAPAPARMP